MNGLHARWEPAKAPDLTPLSADLGAMQSRVAPYVKEVAAPAVGMDVVPAAAGQVALSLEGEIRSRKDVLTLLQKICLYYDRIEPSSPVPLMLKRAARLAEMDFMQIIEDLSPDAIAQVRIITGEKEG